MVTALFTRRYGRMSQDWKNREILVEMHGNNGSMDGDPPAAMRAAGAAG